MVEEGPQPAQARRTPPVAQHAGPHVGVGGVDAHVERGQAIGDDALQVQLGEASQRREVPVEEGEPVVVVLDVQALPQPGRQLEDEAELAVVVAGAHLVEQGGVHLGAQRLARALGDRQVEVEAAPAHLDVEVGLVGQQLPLDDVARLVAIEGDDLVAGLQTGSLRRGPGRDSHHAREGHGSRIRGRWP